MSKWVRVAPVFDYSPNKRRYYIVCELAQNPVGALSDVLGVLASAKLKLISVSASYQPGSDLPVASIFAEPVGQELAADKVKALIEKSPYVVSAQVESSDGGILIESQLFPTQLPTGQRVMLARVDAIGAMLKGVRDLLGTGGDVVVYQEGYNAGLSEASEMVRLIGKQELVNHAEKIAQLRTALGWGKATLTKVRTNPWKAILKLEDSFECRGQNSKTPYSQFVRGHSAGLTEGILGSKVSCTETRCVAVGDPYCEFETVQMGS